ncbi:MAG: hypothetical protein Edafosvirus3_8 [Edafosvirus sp.]|uniref:Zinc finger double-stranded RNA binding domain-containing protein n=1 Tax=Edafosvirus sp. TaxID=2487765 RepID=A0A3G4ZSQ0_9VIRU|nr:MAG: hypothetical protein Edafosvirus3_8 [Edafosvirus sp.]
MSTEPQQSENKQEEFVEQPKPESKFIEIFDHGFKFYCKYCDMGYFSQKVFDIHLGTEIHAKYTQNT